MSEVFDERTWDTLLRRIRAGKCVPFLGAGACYGILPLGGELARKLAEKYKYPFHDSYDLIRVSQFLAVQEFDAIYTKKLILKELFKGEPTPDFNDPNAPHAILADLPFPVYLTTNYDNFMEDALLGRKKDAKQEICRWHQGIENLEMPTDDDFQPSPLNPLVYHLHGHRDIVESLVLTEDDYLGFLVNVLRDSNIIPHYVRRVMATSIYLFIGYSLTDWTFRSLFESVELRHTSIAVQLPPATNETLLEKAKEHLEKYFERYNIIIYWGKATDFLEELHSRWQRFSQED